MFDYFQVQFLSTTDVPPTPNDSNKPPSAQRAVNSAIK